MFISNSQVFLLYHGEVLRGGDREGRRSWVCSNSMGQEGSSWSHSKHSSPPTSSGNTAHGLQAQRPGRRGWRKWNSWGAPMWAGRLPDGPGAGYVAGATSLSSPGPLPSSLFHHFSPATCFSVYGRRTKEKNGLLIDKIAAGDDSCGKVSGPDRFSNWYLSACSIPQFTS